MKIDKKLIKELVDHLSEFNLTELEYQEGQTKIKVSKATKGIEQSKTGAVVSPNKAFHAGKSLHEGLSGLNSHYLGVELLVPGVNDYGSFIKKIQQRGTYSKKQFDTTVEVFKFWMKKFNIPASRVVRHSDVSGDHVRGIGKGKVDPGNAFNWKAFQRALVA